MMSPADLLRKRAAASPDHPALAVADETLSYGRWQRRSEAMAKRLTDAGLRSGDTAALRFSPESFLAYAIAYVAVVDLGAIAVPVAADLRADERARIVQACGADWHLFADREQPDGIGLDRTGLPDLDDARVPRRHATATDIAEIIFTSGTTGEPQGVLCPYGEIGFDYDLTAPPAQGTDGRSVEVHAAAFGTNFCQEMLRGPLKWGSFVITLPRFGIEALREATERYGVTTLRLTPVMAQLLVRNGRTGDLDQIREISVSSAYCPPTVLDKLQRLAGGARIVNQYSLTESGRAKMKHIWGEGPREALGRPVEGTEVRIVGADGDAAPHTQGEIHIRHNGSVARRYLHPGWAGTEVSAEPDWIPTGDIGYRDDDGYVYLLDRAKDLVNVGGRKVSPLAVERVIGAQPGVADTAVCGIPHPTLGEVVAALVVPEASETPPQFDFGATLHPHETPKAVVFTAEIPRNRAGKADRGAVRSAILAGQQHAETAAADGSDELAEEFLSLCTQILERRVDDLDLSWHAAGGDSLSAMELYTTIEETYGVDLPVESFFGDSRLRDMVDQLREGNQ
jgi:acyl-CoA synthetase (AMP-forming)/AMP-acid ligase II/acyl carrier protein